MYKRKLDIEPVAAQLKDYILVVDYCACMVAVSIVRHLVGANYVHIQW
jgi:predicted nucleic acid-binding Zn finger protein